ncbi:hypothetical protein [Hymenobacter ruber]
MQTPSYPMMPAIPAGNYSPLSPLTDAVKAYTEAAISLCAPHGLRPVCFIESDNTGLHMNIEARDKEDNVYCTGMGTDPLVDLQRQLPQSHAAACDRQERTTGFMQRKA